MATFGYGRVSTQDQSTDNQRMEIERAGYSIDYWFADEGVSGAVLASQRPQFREMLGKIRKGESLVVTKIDRLGRDALDIQGTVKELKALGVRVFDYARTEGRSRCANRARVITASTHTIGNIPADNANTSAEPGTLRVASDMMVTGMPVQNNVLPSFQAMMRKRGSVGTSGTVRRAIQE
jgi:hypothetical protein